VIENPCSVIIGEHVQIEHDSIIEANCILKGETRIGTNCRIGCNSYLKDSIIGKNVVLKGYNIVMGTTIEDGDKLSLGEMVLEDE
jgi:bifunctional UDP-N-acetylglucosamine pyrophosphorylase/glucosamine-1-phosphate N-acetyltransferase